jgi:hypothetical protein
MANTVILPIINPIRFYKQTPDTDDRFRSRTMADWYFENTIQLWQQSVTWHQPFQLSDTIKLQLQSNVAPINLKMYNDKDQLIDTIAFSSIMPNYNDPNMYIWQVDVALDGYDEGCYYFTIDFGIDPAQMTLKSHMIMLRETFSDTVFIEYNHRTFREDMIFETGIQPGIRVPAFIKYKAPNSKNTLWEDQSLNQTMVRSTNYRLWTLSIGAGKGVPDYMADIIDRVLGCSTLIIDGRYYSKVDGSLDVQEVDEYPMRGWSIDLREQFNRASNIYDDLQNAEAQVAVMINVDSKGFGADTGGNENVISDVF